MLQISTFGISHLFSYSLISLHDSCDRTITRPNIINCCRFVVYVCMRVCEPHVACFVFVQTQMDSSVAAHHHWLAGRLDDARSTLQCRRRTARMMMAMVQRHIDATVRRRRRRRTADHAVVVAALTVMLVVLHMDCRRLQGQRNQTG